MAFLRKTSQHALEEDRIFGLSPLLVTETTFFVYVVILAVMAVDDLAASVEHEEKHWKSEK